MDTKKAAEEVDLNNKALEGAAQTEVGGEEMHMDGVEDDGNKEPNSATLVCRSR